MAEYIRIAVTDHKIACFVDFVFENYDGRVPLGTFKMKLVERFKFPIYEIYSPNDPEFKKLQTPLARFYKVIDDVVYKGSCC